MLAILVGLILAGLGAYVWMGIRVRSGPVPTKVRGRECDRIVTLRVPRGFHELAREIRAFNGMRPVMPCIGVTPVAYIKILGRLYNDPKFRAPVDDHIEKLFYAYASYNLGQREKDTLRRRQFLKNVISLFVSDTVIKKRQSILRIIRQPYFPLKQMPFKIMGGRLTPRNETPFEIRTEGTRPDFRVRQSDSYTVWESDGLVVKHYQDVERPVGCYLVRSGVNFKFVLKTEAKKFDVTVNQSAETFYITCTKTKQVTAVYVPGARKTFGSNMARRDDNLEVHIDFDMAKMRIGTEAKIYVIQGENKQAAIATLNSVKESAVRYLLSPDQIYRNRQAEEVMATLQRSSYTSGEGLRRKYLQTGKVVRSIHLPSIVVMVQEASEFFALVDDFDRYKLLASCGVSFNLVIVYSSQNRSVFDAIEDYTNRDEARDMIKHGILLYFVDRMTVPNDVVYYLTRVYEAGERNATLKNVTAPVTNHPKVIASLQSGGKGYSLFLQSKLNKSVTVRALVPLCLGKEGRGVIVTRSGTRLGITNMATGRRSVLSVPGAIRVYTPAGRMVGAEDCTTDSVVLGADAVLKSYGEKIWDIRKSVKVNKETDCDPDVSVIPFTQEENYGTKRIKNV